MTAEGGVDKVKKQPADINVFIGELNKLLTQDEITLKGVNSKDRCDNDLIMRIALRGKTVDEYFELVDQLFVANDATKSKEEKKRLGDLTGRIMGIGEDTLGIDWS